MGRSSCKKDKNYGDEITQTLKAQDSKPKNIDSGLRREGEDG